MKRKKCYKCGLRKRYSEFHTDKSRGDSTSYICKTCVKERRRQYYLVHKARELLRNRQYYKSNKEFCRDYIRQWTADNKDAVKASRDSWRRSNRAKILEQERRYARSHPEKIRDKRNRRRAMKAAAAVIDFTPEQWYFVQCMFNHRCAYCGKKAKLTQDHILPLSRGGDHTLSNIVPACSPCNSKKGSKCLSELQ